MMLDFACPGCGQKYRVDVGLSGRKIKCKKCETPVTVPSPNAATTTASKPPVQAFGEAPKPRPRPPVQSFGEAPRTTPAPSRRPAPPSEDEFDYGMDDVEGSAADPYGMDDEYAPPVATRHEADDEFAAPGRLGKLGSSKSGKLQPAGVWKRLCASIVDFTVIGLLNSVAALAFGFSVGLYYAFSLHRAPTAEELVGIQRYWRAIAAIGFFLYFTVLDCSSSQATLGKAAMKLKVTDMDGRRISFLRSAGRTLASYLSLATCGIGYFAALFNENKQTLHDLIARTRVVMK